MTRKIVALGLVLAVLGALGFGASRLAWSKVQGLLGERLRTALGAQACDVGVQASWLDLYHGRIPAVDVHAQRMHADGRPDIERLDVVARNLRVSDLKLAGFDGAHFTATVSQEALNAWIPTRKKRGEHEPEEQVTLNAGRLEVRFVLRKGVLSPPVTGTLHAKGPIIELVLDMNRLRALLPARLVKSMEKRTLVDMSDGSLPPVDITTLRIEPHQLVVEGDCHPVAP